MLHWGEQLSMYVAEIYIFGNDMQTPGAVHSNLKLILRFGLFAEPTGISGFTKLIADFLISGLAEKLP